jgi:hypothetical protein
MGYRFAAAVRSRRDSTAIIIIIIIKLSHSAGLLLLF